MSSIHHIIKQFLLVSDWYLSVLDGIKEQDGSKTLSDHTNSLEWLAGHLITGRYRNLVRLGVQVEPYKHIDKFVNQTMPPPNAIAFSKAIQYPTLEESKQQWNVYTKILLERIRNADDKILKATIPFTVLTGGNTVEDALAFTTLHETYHIGQMSILRKELGYAAMQLTRRN